MIASVRALIIALIMRLYAVSVHLYPRPFRSEFEEEMRAVFADVVAEATERGGASLVVVCWRELWHLPRALLCEYWFNVRNRIEETEMSKTASALEAQDRGRIWVTNLLEFY